jgi:hypothetical protein
MNHTIASLQEFAKVSSDPDELQAVRDSLDALAEMHKAGTKLQNGIRSIMQIHGLEICGVLGTFRRILLPPAARF